MRLCLFDGGRLGAVAEDHSGVVDVTAAVPGWAGDDLGAGWWRRLCRDLPRMRPALEEADETGTPRPLSTVALRPPVLNPTKVVAAASNYRAHVSEMHEVQERTLGGVQVWMMDFDVFLKAPSSIVGPRDTVRIPPDLVAEGREVHHESELAIVVGAGGSHLHRDDALDAVAGYCIAIDVTARGEGDRSRRKSYDTFTPLGPWLTTRDEVPDPGALQIRLRVDGQVRQQVDTADLLTDVPGIIAYASSVMRLDPGDVILTGAPPGVGPIRPGELMEVEISRLGSMSLPVR